MQAVVRLLTLHSLMYVSGAKKVSGSQQKFRITYTKVFAPAMINTSAADN